MSDDARVLTYFDTHAESFDAIYTGKKNALLRWLDAWLRADMRGRWELTFALAGDVRGQHVCDVGCGSGRYAIEFARRGAARVVGLDYAPRMIELARRLAGEAGIGDVCEFVCAGLLDHDLGGTFDLSLAIGVFDYVRDPAPLLARIREITRGRLIATFPVRWRLRMPLRKARLTLSGCPVYFFTEEELGRLFRTTGYAAHKVVYRGQIYLVAADAR